MEIQHMNNTQFIEKHVAKMFLDRIESDKVCDDDIFFGDHIKNEPDILYKDMGIEIGAVQLEINNRIDEYEKKFLSKASETLKGRIPETMQVSLVMQDDNNMVEHKPTAYFKDYKYLPEFLDGIFVNQYKNDQLNNQVVLNQKLGIRTCTFPSIKKNKEFFGFMNELVNYINSLKQSDFVQQEDFSFHHVVVTEVKIGNKFTNPIMDFIPDKILDKLSRDKYSGSYIKQILLLHNYSIAANTEFTTDIHFYTHHRNDIFNLLWQHINKYQSFKIYDGIYFLDFSMYNLNNNFDLIDFKNYSRRKPSKFLNGFGEIRFI